MHHNCPICFEYLFDTPRDTTVLPCGHTIHLDCVKEMERHFQYSCPVCSKSYCDMTCVWERPDQEVNRSYLYIMASVGDICVTGCVVSLVEEVVNCHGPGQLEIGLCRCCTAPTPAPFVWALFAIYGVVEFTFIL